jgi:hypothetical protein
LFIDYHIVPELYFPNGCMAASGTFLNWIVRNWARGEVEKASTAGLSIHQWLDRRAVEVPVEGDLLFLPYMLGEKTPLMDPHARGTLIGLGLHHDLRHICVCHLVPRLSRLHRPQLIDRLRNPQPHALPVDIAFSEHFIRLGRSFNIGRIAVVGDHERSAAPDVDVGDHSNALIASTSAVPAGNTSHTKKSRLAIGMHER